MVGHIYTEEEHAFLVAFIPGHTYKEIVAEYNARFAEPITESRVKGYMANHKINNGLTGRFKPGHIPHNKGKHPPTVGRMSETQFKPGNMPHNTKPLGYERISKDGYIEVKVRMRPSSPGGHDFFELKHRHVWEEANAPIPEGYNIIFLDGNKQNVSLENLLLVSKEESLQMTRLKLRSTNRELTKSGVLIAQLGCVIKKKGKKHENTTDSKN